MPIWKLTTRICFDTTYYVVAEEAPTAEKVMELAKDGYVPEFSQENTQPEYALHNPLLEVTEQEYKGAWHPSINVTDQEKMDFLPNLDVKTPEDLSEVGTEETL